MKCATFNQVTSKVKLLKFKNKSVYLSAGIDIVKHSQHLNEAAK